MTKEIFPAFASAIFFAGCVLLAGVSHAEERAADAIDMQQPEASPAAQPGPAFMKVPKPVHLHVKTLPTPVRKAQAPLMTPRLGAKLEKSAADDKQFLPIKSSSYQPRHARRPVLQTAQSPENTAPPTSATSKQDADKLLLYVLGEVR